MIIPSPSITPCSAPTSVVVAEQSVADKLLAALGRAGAYVAKPAEVALLRDYLFGKGSFNIDAGESAADIAQQVGLRIPSSSRIIVTGSTGSASMSCSRRKNSAQSLASCGCRMSRLD